MKAMIVFGVVALISAVSAYRLSAEAEKARPPAGVAVLLEENAAELLPLLNNPTGDPGEGLVERGDVFSGASAVKIVPMQRFSPGIPGWAFRIVERPAAGEYRYVRFAWKADGCIGIMLQLHDEKDWNIRYVAGVDAPGWGSKQVAAKPPGRWSVVTRDLFADFGERTIKGIALTAFEGRAGYFDHIYFGRSIDDLDRIEAAGQPPVGPAGIGEAELERLWTDLCGDDARKAYRNRMALMSDPARSVPFLKKKVKSPLKGEALAAMIAQWVTDLDADEVVTRDAASEHLARHIDAAIDSLRREAGSSESPEARVRAAAILKEKDQRGPWPDPTAEAERVVRLVGE